MNSELFHRFLQIAGSRTVLLLVPITDMIVIGMTDFDEIGRFSVAALIVQVFVVLAGGLFVGNYIRQTEHTSESNTASIVIAFVAGLLSGAVLTALAFLLKGDVRSILLLAAPGIVPLFIFACCASILESSGHEKFVFRLTVSIVLANIVLDFVMVRLISDPADAVMLAATIARAGLGGVALVAISKTIRPHRVSVIRDEARAILEKGISEAFTRAIFVMGMASSMSYAALKLTKVEMSIVGAVLNYMNLLFICGTAVTLASAVELRGGVERKVIRWFLRFGTSAGILIFLAGSGVSWGVIVLLWNDMSDILLPAVLLAVTAVCLDGIGNQIIMALRAMGNTQFPPFTRLVMFPNLLVILMLTTEPGSTDVFAGITLGNGCVLLLLTVIFIRTGRNTVVAAQGHRS